MRVFLALPLPPPVIAYLERMRAYLRHRGVAAKWVSAEASHLTVLFLGEQDPPRVEALARAVADRCRRLVPIELRTGALTTFGRPPRVLVFELQDEPGGAFAATVEGLAECAIAENLDLPPSALRAEARPHLTLARFRDGREARSLDNIGTRRDVGWEWKKPVPEPPPGAGCFRCGEAALFKSTLTADGPIYDELARWPLGE
ncbi:MAG: 2',5' RNA ligase family [Lentisphaerae bacterium ADurb.BinA184]|nr:MAG: 2',5' RNA ligase family [Lentisphaerae bacterium ADurb.BinA184]